MDRWSVNLRGKRGKSEHRRPRQVGGPIGEPVEPEDIGDSTGERSPGDATTIFRLLVFVVVGFGGVYFILQSFVTPSFSLVDVIVPPGELPLDRSAVLRIRVTNENLMTGRAHGAVFLPGDAQVDGPTAPVRRGDTVTLPVPLSLGEGQHVVSMAVIDAESGNRSVGGFFGLVLRFGPGHIEIDRLSLPERIPQEEPIPVRISGTNPTSTAQTVLPTVAFHPDAAEGDPIELEGPEWEIDGLGTATVDFTLDPGAVPPGHYFVRVRLRTADGDRAGRSRYPVPVEVLQ